MRVLYSDHTALVSGAERSLLELLKALPEDVEPVLASPSGKLADEAGRAGVRHVPLPGTAGSLRLHPLHTPRAVAELTALGGRLWATARQERVDLVHANTLQAALAAGAARRAGGPPLVVHIRDCLPATGAGRLVRRWIAKTADELIAISRFTADCFGPQARTVIPNAVDLDRFSSAIADRGRLRAELGISPDAPVLSVVAQITPWKGQIDAIETMASLRTGHPDAHLLIVGEAKFTSAATRYDNVRYLEDLHRCVGGRRLDACVHFLGERDDVPDVLAATDLLLVPSWEEPFGRTVVEAMAAGVPVIATSIGGPAEIIEDGVDGLLLGPREPRRWAEAAVRLLGDPRRREEMGAAARRKARARYGREEHAARVAEVYRRLV